MTDEYLTLKWGTLKAWNFEGNEKAIPLLEEYYEDGVSLGAMTQHDTPNQKRIICELIDVGNFDTVYLDWDDKEVTKEEAKEYVRSYGK